MRRGKIRGKFNPFTWEFEGEVEFSDEPKSSGIVARIGADKLEVDAGDEVMIEWATIGAKKAWLTIGEQEPIPAYLNGSMYHRPEESMAYVIRAYDDNGVRASDEVVVKVMSGVVHDSV